MERSSGERTEDQGDLFDAPAAAEAPRETFVVRLSGRSAALVNAELARLRESIPGGRFVEADAVRLMVARASSMPAPVVGLVAAPTPAPPPVVEPPPVVRDLVGEVADALLAHARTVKTFTGTVDDVRSVLALDEARGHTIGAAFERLRERCPSARVERLGKQKTERGLYDVWLVQPKPDAAAPDAPPTIPRAAETERDLVLRIVIEEGRASKTGAPWAFCATDLRPILPANVTVVGIANALEYGVRHPLLTPGFVLTKGPLVDEGGLHQRRTYALTASAAEVAAPLALAGSAGDAWRALVKAHGESRARAVVCLPGVLTAQQRRVVEATIAGRAAVELAAEMACTRQRVHGLWRAGMVRLAARLARKDPAPR